MQKVIIEIDEAGATELKVEGCAGPGCHKLSEGLSKALGSVTSDTKLPEYHRAATQQNQAKAGQ